MVQKKFRYEIVNPYEEEINKENDFLDVEVEIAGKKYRGSVTTTEFIDGRLKYYQETGENQEGCYFCAKGMIVLRDLKEETIKRTLQDLIEREDFQDFFKS